MTKEHFEKDELPNGLGLGPCELAANEPKGGGTTACLKDCSVAMLLLRR